MFYFILIVATVLALMLIFRDDHDKSYDRRDDSARKFRPEIKSPVITQKEQAKQDRTDQPEVQRSPLSGRELSWSYLYSLDYDEGICGDTMETEITGMRYYCTMADVGPVNGTVRPEPGNPHDVRAQVVIRADGKKLGYIPRHDLDEYEAFNDDDLVCPFAGEVKVDPNGYMHADILVALPESLEFVKEELTEYLESL